jgi:hypothetical protein
MPPSPLPNEATPRKSYKNMRHNWHQQSRRNVHKTIRFGQNQSRNAFLRNLPGTNIMSTIRSTKKNNKGRHIPYENRPKGNYKFNKKLTQNAVRYRKITNMWTPHNRGHTRLGKKSSKILANTFAAAAPNYNYQTMVNSVWARNNIDFKKKGHIADRLYELYGPEENENENNNTWSVEGTVNVAPPPAEQTAAVNWR